jgi:hypothetical protein
MDQQQSQGHEGKTPMAGFTILLQLRHKIRIQTGKPGFLAQAIGRANWFKTGYPPEASLRLFNQAVLVISLTLIQFRPFASPLSRLRPAYSCCGRAAKGLQVFYSGIRFRPQAHFHFCSQGNGVF